MVIDVSAMSVARIHRRVFLLLAFGWVLWSVIGADLIVVGCDTFPGARRSRSDRLEALAGTGILAGHDTRNIGDRARGEDRFCNLARHRRRTSGM